MKDAGKNLEIRFSIPRGRARMGLMITLLLSSAYLVGSETLTLNTFYPSPLGIYKMLTSTGQTTLARDSGGVNIGGAANRASLSVSGTTILGNLPNDPVDGSNGAIYYNTNSNIFRGYANGSWGSFGGGMSFVGECVAPWNGSCRCNKGETIMLLDGMGVSYSGTCLTYNQNSANVFGYASGDLATAALHCHYSCFK